MGIASTIKLHFVHILIQNKGKTTESKLVGRLPLPSSNI